MDVSSFRPAESTKGQASSGGQPSVRFSRSRPAVLLGLILVLAMVWGTMIITDATGGDSLGVRGADISFTLQGEAIGQTLNVRGEPLPIEAILAGYEATHARLRVWVDPADGTSDLESALVLAKRINAAGMKLVVDLHYSDTWADRTNQQLPEAWSSLSQGQLLVQVESYTRETVAAFAAQATPVDIIQIGNEINNGFMWPAGAIFSSGGQRWLEFTDLLRAGIQGARNGGTAPPPTIMIHVDTGGDVDSSVAFFDRLRDFGIDFDLIGLSYYPFWNGPLSKLTENLHALADRYGKDILIAETAYPWTLESGEAGPTVVNDIAALPEAELYPPTPEGQADFFQALARVLREVPDGRGAGFLIWEPAWPPGVPATELVGNTHNNLTLFDWSGNALPALAAFQENSGD